jgi:RNA recognition motif-containing protein
MLSTTEETIWKAMESVRGSERLERVKKLRDFAFVHFSDRESAKAAMEYWDSMYYCSTDIINQIEYSMTQGAGRLTHSTCRMWPPLMREWLCNTVCHGFSTPS